MLKEININSALDVSIQTLLQLCEVAEHVGLGYSVYNLLNS